VTVRALVVPVRVVIVRVRSSVRMGMTKCAMTMPVAFDKFIRGQGHQAFSLREGNAWLIGGILAYLAFDVMIVWGHVSRLRLRAAIGDRMDRLPDR
jgi:hypothetical protein